MQKPNYLPAMSYLLITSFFSEWNVLSAPMVVNTFLIWVLANGCMVMVIWLNSFPGISLENCFAIENQQSKKSTMQQFNNQTTQQFNNSAIT
jgi:hypothetical protein